MYVRKFEADSLEEALKDIKQELGPDAIILKTVTNKGLKGAFKKSRIEITAAISEKNYTKKSKVDHVLGEEHKQSFYNNQASYISNMIDNYSDNKNQEQAASKNANGYGGLGLNRAVNVSKNATQQAQSSTQTKLSPVLKASLDDFLDKKEENETREAQNFEETYRSQVQEREERFHQQENESAREERDAQKRKIEELERQLFDLSKHIERLDKREPVGIFQLRTTLKSLDISDNYIQKITKKATFELSREDLENQEIVFEFALREMMAEIPTSMPMFSSLDSTETPVITVLISETSTGQTSMMQKIGALKPESVLIKNGVITQEDARSFTDKVFNLNIVLTKSIAEMVSECRRAVESGRSVFIDYRASEGEMNETKKFIDGLRRSFDKVEVLITLCAIQSELYNKKVISRYSQLADGLTVSHLDLCMNFGALFNIVEGESDLPYKFYGTGEVVPDDLEAATAERILAGIFQFE